MKARIIGYELDAASTLTLFPEKIAFLLAEVSPSSQSAEIPEHIRIIYYQSFEDRKFPERIYTEKEYLYLKLQKLIRPVSYCDLKKDYGMRRTVTPEPINKNANTCYLLRPENARLEDWREDEKQQLTTDGRVRIIESGQELVASDHIVSFAYSANDSCLLLATRKGVVA